MITASIAPPALQIVRLPGEFGPILRCSGELSVATAESLRRELALLMPMGHSVLTLSLSGCRFLDVAGIMVILDACKVLRLKGRRLVVVAGTSRISRLLQVTGVDRFLLLFPNEESATIALRGGGLADPAPETWKAAREETVSRWQAIRAALDEMPPEDLLYHLTSMTALCERSEELFQERVPLPDDHSAPGQSRTDRTPDLHWAPISTLGAPAARCHFCPLYYALGGLPADIGCRSVLDPMIDAVRWGDPETARGMVTHLIRTIEEMPLPEELPVPVPWLPSALGDPAVR